MGGEKVGMRPAFQETKKYSQLRPHGLGCLHFVRLKTHFGFVKYDFFESICPYVSEVCIILITEV